MGPRFDNRSLDPALTFRPLFREQFAVVARRGHPLAGARSFAELADAEWLRVQGSAGRAVGSIAFSKPPVYLRPDRSFTAIR
jgi:DNA-binding transcriptional LysR family regulator